MKAGSVVVQAVVPRVEPHDDARRAGEQPWGRRTPPAATGARDTAATSGRDGRDEGAGDA